MTRSHCTAIASHIRPRSLIAALALSCACGGPAEQGNAPVMSQPPADAAQPTVPTPAGNAPASSTAGSSAQPATNTAKAGSAAVPTGGASGAAVGAMMAIADPAAGSGAGSAATSPPAAAGAQAPAVACDPADMGPEAKPASFKQIMGYQNLSEPPTTGPFKPVLEEDPGMPEWTVYRPETLGEALHPVLAWGEGGCLKNGTLYGNWLLELASHGYIAIADGPPTEAGSDPVGAGMRMGATGEVLVSALDWLVKENDRPCSRYYRKIATDKLAVAGQSCGGLMALYSAGDKRVTTAIIGNSGLFAADPTTYSALHGPIAYLIGGPSDVAYQNAERDFMNIENVPIFYANMDTGHGGTWNAHNGGEFGRVGTAWLDWQLKGDMTAAKLFIGPDCELCQSGSMWDVQKKMLD
jgi:hypothetical protein